MPIRMQCQCGQVLGVKEEFAGKVVKCPKCQNALRVPQPQAAGAPAGGQALGGGLDSLFDDVGIKSAKDRAPTCPSCKAVVQPNAVLCVNCGFDFRSGEMRRSVGSIADNLSMKSEAEKRVARAAKNINQSEIQNNSDSFGDAGSIWAWLMPFALPFLLVFSVSVIVYWAFIFGGAIVGLFGAAISAGWYEMFFPALTFVVGLVLFVMAWWQVSFHCIRVNVWLGIASLGTIGFFTAFFGLPFWKDTKFNMIMYAVAINLFAFSILCALQFWLFHLAGLFALVYTGPFLLGYVAFILNYVYWIRLTVLAFSEGMLQGLLAMFTYVYAPIYGIMRWKYCKWETSFWLGSFGVLMMCFLIAIILSIAVLAIPFSDLSSGELVPQS